MTSALVKSRSPYLTRVITHRTRGLTRGPVTRLMSPSDFGEILKPFVFLDLFDHEGPPFNGALHPHSGIATLTYVAEGAVTYIDPNGERGTLRAGGVEWMQAGRGMWHGGGLDQSGRTRGFQLWIALPTELELGRTISLFQAPDEVRIEGPARVLLGNYGSASSAIASPAPINYLAVRLSAGQRWRYTPPAGHTVLFGAAILASSRLRTSRSNSKLWPLLSLFWVRPLRTSMISLLVTIRFIPRQKHFAMVRRTSCQFSIVS
jgi:redox-sensitive bicupin YhaK (pirin superfamily)